MFSYYFLYFELISLVISLLCVKKLQGTYLFLFIPFLILTNIQEWGSYYGYLSINGNNIVSLNIFTNIEFAFYSYILYYHTAEKKQKKRILILYCVFFFFAFLNIFFIQGLTNFHSYSYLLGSLLIIYYVCYFFYELFQSEKYINLLKFPMFWICIGLLFFYLGMFVYYTFFELVTLKYILQYVTLFNVLMNIFNIVLYSFFAISFLCPKPQKNII